MKKNITKSILSALLVLCMITSFTGCKKNSDSDDTTEIIDANSQSVTETDTNYGNGHYVEYIYQPAMKSDYGMPIYHIVPNNSSMKVANQLTLTLSNYICTLGSNGTWTQEEIICLPSDSESQFICERTIIGEDGNEYLLAKQWIPASNARDPYCIFKKNGDTAEQVMIPCLGSLLTDELALDESGPLHELCNFTVLSNQDMVLFFADYIQYLEHDGTLRTPLYDINGYAAILADDKIYALSDSLDTLNIYDLQSGELTQQISTKDLSLKQSNKRVAVLTKDSENNIYLQCAKGIYELRTDTTTFIQVVDGALNSMASGEELPCELYIDENGNFLNIRADQNFCKWTLYQYVYSSEAASYPEDELNIYSLYDNPEIRAAITQYQKENPDILVNYEIAINPEDETTLTLRDYIQQLNTELLASKGPDIIFLDGLNIKNLIEKGVLADITREIEQNPDIFEVVKHTFTIDNQIYAIPSRIHIPVIAGTEAALQATATLQDLADYTETSEKTLFGCISQTNLVSYLYRAYKDEILDDNRTIDADQVRNFLTNIKTVCDQSCLLTGYVDSANSLYLTKEDQASLGISTISDAYTINEIIYLLDRAEKPMTSFHCTYIPSNIFSINKNTNKMDEALNFLQVLLSGNIQETDNYSFGIAVNKKVIPAKAIRDGADMRPGLCQLDFYNLDGTVKSQIIPYATEEQSKLYCPLYDEIETPMIYDAILDETMMAYINDYLDGNTTLDEATTNISSFYSIYNEE